MGSKEQVFREWLVGQAEGLRRLPPEQAAEEIGDFVQSIDQRLGAEVADDGDGTDSPRELVVTAFSDQTAFELVKALVEALPPIDGWTVTALKPPRGFDFQLDLDGTSIDASTLEFSPAAGAERGIHLLLSAQSAEEIAELDDELAWLIVEAGIGEELCARLGEVRFAPWTEARMRWPLRQLAEYVKQGMESLS